MRLHAMIVALALSAAACAPVAPDSAPAASAPAQIEQAQADFGPAVGMANPASVACEDQFHGRLSMAETSDGGQIGMCHLPDGRVCEEWGLFRDNRCMSASGQVVTPSRSMPKGSGKNGG